MKKLIVIYSFVVLFSVACSDETVIASCGPDVIESENFSNLQSDPFFISSAQIVDNCIEIEISTGGCDGTTWTAELYKSPLENLSLPPQFLMKLVLNDDEACEAAIRRSFNFDLSTLVSENEEFIISLEGWDTLLQYPSASANKATGN